MLIMSLFLNFYWSGIKVYDFPELGYEHIILSTKFYTHWAPRGNMGGNLKIRSDYNSDVIIKPLLMHLLF